MVKCWSNLENYVCSWLAETRFLTLRYDSDLPLGEKIDKRMIIHFRGIWTSRLVHKAWFDLNFFFKFAIWKLFWWNMNQFIIVIITRLARASRFADKRSLISTDSLII